MNNLTCLVPVSAIVSVSLLVCSCSTSDPASSGTAITNVKYFHLDHEQEIETPDMMIRFERQHYMHGAITADEKRDREGHYYVIWWESKDKTTPATLLFEYRQLLTGPEIQTIEVPIDRIRKKNKTHILLALDSCLLTLDQ